MHPNLQIQEPNKLSNPEIQNQQSPTFKFKNHIHISKPQIEKKKKSNQILTENPLHIFKIEKLKKTHYRKPRNEHTFESARGVSAIQWRKWTTRTTS